MIRFLPVLTLVACAAPDAGYNSSVNVEVVSGADAADQRLIDVIDGAQSDLHVAMPFGQDLALSDALIAAQDRGVAVDVVTDIDQVDDPANVALADAGVPLTLADGALSYFDFAMNADIGWTSAQVKMSSAFAVADRQEFAGATSVGTGGDGSDIVVSGHYEDLSEDLWLEANQLFGGTDASSVDSHDAMAKSIADYRWRYGMGSDAWIEMWFGPQERVTKRVIDNVYSARKSVWVLTDDFANEGLATALEAKAADGFDVQVVVGPHFGQSSSGLSRLLTDAAHVTKMQVTDVEHVPTVVIIDGDGDGRTLGRAMFATHDLYSAARAYRGSAVVSDQTIDGVLWQIDDWGAKSAMFNDVVGVFNDHKSRAEPL